MSEIDYTNRIDVLDKGYVRLVPEGTTGSDLTVVNAARVSYDKAVTEMGERDEKLIKYLAEHGHTSPFRHAMLQFEVYAPLMVARQWWKYVVGSDHVMDAWNESSRRYITEEPTFHLPDVWRSAPDNSKQGSGEPVSQELQTLNTAMLQKVIGYCSTMYDQAIADGICAEQARLFLPAYGMYVRWYWTGSLLSVSHLLNQRLAHDAQVEFQNYAGAVGELTQRRFPISLKYLVR